MCCLGELGQSHVVSVRMCVCLCVCIHAHTQTKRRRAMFSGRVLSLDALCPAVGRMGLLLSLVSLQDRAGLGRSRFLGTSPVGLFLFWLSTWAQIFMGKSLCPQLQATDDFLCSVPSWSGGCLPAELHLVGDLGFSLVGRECQIWERSVLEGLQENLNITRMFAL